jgi:hypothetical protein
VCNDGSGSGLCQLRHLGLPRFRALHAGGNTPTSCLAFYYLHSGYNAPRAVRSRGGRRRWVGSPRLRVQTPLYRRGSVYRLGGRLPAPLWLHLQRDPLALPCPHLTMALYKAPFPLGPASGRHMPSLLPQILSWGRLLLAGWWSLDVACVMPILCLCRSCWGQATFGETAVGGSLSSSPGSGSPRWSRRPAAGAAGPSGRAGLLNLAPWRFLGCQPVDSTALGIPQKSSPRH